MKTEASHDAYYRWNKSDVDKPLSLHFLRSEFNCKCQSTGCKSQKIHFFLLTRLERVRQKIGVDMFISSGYRCEKYQAHLKTLGYETATGVSQHELGMAADIVCEDMVGLLPLLEDEFKSIGISKRFIHVDLRDDKIRKWYYKI